MVFLAGVDCQVPFWFPSPHWPELYEFIRGSAALRWHYSRPPGHVSHMRSICTALTEGQPATQNKWNTCTATAKVVSMFYFYSYFKVKICMFKCKTKVKYIYRLKKNVGEYQDIAVHIVFEFNFCPNISSRIFLCHNIILNAVVKHLCI